MFQNPLVRDWVCSIDMHGSDLGGGLIFPVPGGVKRRVRRAMPTYISETSANDFALQEYYVSGFNVLVPAIVKALDINEDSSTWPASAFSLVVSCFLLPMGRLSDMYGGKRLFVLGVGWLVIFSILGGIARTELMLVFARALQGLGPAAFLPSSVMLLGSVYRPGPRKNLVSYYYFYFCLILRQPQLESRSPSAPQTLRAG